MSDLTVRENLAGEDPKDLRPRAYVGEMIFSVGKHMQVKGTQRRWEGGLRRAYLPDTLSDQRTFQVLLLSRV
jgi:hypothetical protein